MWTKDYSHTLNVDHKQTQFSTVTGNCRPDCQVKHGSLTAKRNK